MTTSVLSFDSAVSLNKSIPASITFISPKHYANILWLNKCLDIYEGPRVIGTFIVTEITNPILDANAEKWIFIDGRDIHTLNDFFDQIEQKLTSKIDFKIGRNMNAFSDLLWGGFGIHEYAEPLHIVWIYSTQSRKALGTNISIQSYQLLKTTKVITNTWNYTMNIYFDLSLRGIRFQILDKMSLFDKDYLSSL